MDIKTICHGGYVVDTKELERNGEPIGTVRGYIATWDVDRGDWSGVKDKFMPGAFKEDLARHEMSGRQIRLKSMHDRTIGGFPIESVREDSTGLFGVGEINLNVQDGREVFNLAKQGVLSDFSIGWSADKSDMRVEDDIRYIAKAQVWEGSIVDEPMNPHAIITEVKELNSDDLSKIDIRILEAALKTGIKFSNRNAKKLIALMKSSGMLSDEHSNCRDDDISDALNKILKTIKGVV